MSWERQSNEQVNKGIHTFEFFIFLSHYSSSSSDSEPRGKRRADPRSLLKPRPEGTGRDTNSHTAQHHCQHLTHELIIPYTGGPIRTSTPGMKKQDLREAEPFAWYTQL